MSFRDLEEFLDPTLKLPIRGKTYTVQSPDAKTGLWVQALFIESKILDDDDERAAFQRVLGDTFDEMSADGVPWEYVKHAATTAMLWIVHGKDAADRFWNGGGDTPKAPKRKRKGGGKKGRPDSGGSSTPPASSEASTSDGPTSSATGA